MGFEVTFHYREEITKGEYAEEVKKKTIKVGEPYEEVSLDLVAGKVIAQLAHPKKLIVDVEIYEYTKKKLSYKEAEDGILIKNRKFSFDDGPVVTSSAVEETDTNAQLLNLLQQNPDLVAKLLNGGAPGTALVTSNGNRSVTKPGVAPTGRPIKKEMYDPTDPRVIDQNKGYFTINREYSIYEESGRGLTAKYVVFDDKGNRRLVASDWFVPPPKRLEYENAMMGGSDKKPDIQLSYGSTVDGEIPMPDIRRR